MRHAAAICAAFLCTTAGIAADYPSLKPGLWESQVLRQEGQSTKMPVTQLCIDASMIKDMMQMGQSMQKSMCSRNDMHFSGNKFYAEAECNFGGSTMKSKSVTAFSGDSAYRTEVHATYDPAFMGQKESTTVVEAKWKGSCPAGMQAGDVVMPGGMKMNMRMLNQGGK